MNPKTKKILFIALFALDLALTVFLFVVSIIMIATMPKTKNEIDTSTFKGKFLYTSVGKFVRKKPFVSGLALGLMCLIIVLVAILVVRSINNGKKKRKRKARPYNGNVSL